MKIIMRKKGKEADLDRDIVDDIRDFLISSNKWSDKIQDEVLIPIFDYNDKIEVLNEGLNYLDDEITKYTLKQNKTKIPSLMRKKKQYETELQKLKVKPKPNKLQLQRQFIDKNLNAILKDYCGEKQDTSPILKHVCTKPPLELKKKLKTQLLTSVEDIEESLNDY